MPEPKTIVAIGAHTGDAQLTMGMLLAKHAMRGDRCVVLDLTAGERGAPAGRATDEFRRYNIECAGEFARKIGAESRVLDVPDGELEDTKELELRVADILREVKADAVLCHWKHSMHKDHIAAYTIAQNAVFFAALPTYPHALPPAPIRSVQMAENWEDAEGFQPYCYYDVTEAFPVWKDAIKSLWLAEHSTSMAYLRYYEALSVVRGALIRKDHATAFAVEPFGMRQVGSYLV